MIDVKNAVLIAVVLAVVAFVGVYIPYVQYQGRSDVPAIPGESVSVRVVYTNKGFEPASVTVPIGATVEWVNESDKLMWVASDDHPSHTDLPGFDQKGSEGNANPPQSAVPIAYAHGGVEIFRYTFLTAGHWEYHNHLVPADDGVVIVE